MLNRFMQNTKKPQGFLGKLMLRRMNTGHHAQLAQWGLSKLTLQGSLHIVDVGCGGGANIARMLKELPESRVDGVDYSAESVAFSKNKNASELGKRCHIQQGDVLQLPYPRQSLDLVTAFETIYFWSDVDAAFKEMLRVLKPGGIFFICCESENADDTTWPDRIEGMTIYRGSQLKDQLLRAGFKDVVLHQNEKGWMCLVAQC